MPIAKDTARNTTKTSKPAAAPARQVAKTVSPRSGKTAPDAPRTQPASDAMRGNGAARLSPEEVYRLIQESAYFKAKARGFSPGHEVQDWIEAEAEVRRRLEDRA
jgi:hypothetical protein